MRLKSFSPSPFAVAVATTTNFAGFPAPSFLHDECVSIGMYFIWDLDRDEGGVSMYPEVFMRPLAVIFNSISLLVVDFECSRGGSNHTCQVGIIYRGEIAGIYNSLIVSVLVAAPTDDSLI